MNKVGSVTPGLATPLSEIPYFAWWILLLMTVDNVLNTIDRNVVSILKTTLKSHFQIGDADYSLLVTAFMVPYAVFYVICGRIVDRYGSRVTLTAFVAIWSAATLAAGASQTFGQLVATRVVLGAAEAGLLPATVYALVKWFPRDRLATVYAIKTPLQALGPTLCAPVVAILALSLGWRAAFIVPATLGIAFAVLWWVSDRNSPTYRESSVVEPVAAAGGGFFQLLSMPVLWGILFARLVTDPVWFFFQYWQAGYLQEELGASLADVGRLLWIPPLATCVLTFFTARASDRMIARGVTPAKARLRVMQATVVIAPTIMIAPFVKSSEAFVALSSAIFFMTFTWLYLSNVLIANLFPKSLVGSAIGVVNCIGTIGAAAFNGAAGTVIERWGYMPIFVAMFVAFPIAALVVQFYYRDVMRGQPRAIA